MIDHRGAPTDDPLLDSAATAFLCNGDSANLTTFEQVVKVAARAIKTDGMTVIEVAELHVRKIAGSLPHDTDDRLQILLETLDRFAVLCRKR